MHPVCSCWLDMFGEPSRIIQRFKCPSIQNCIVLAAFLIFLDYFELFSHTRSVHPDSFLLMPVSSYIICFRFCSNCHFCFLLDFSSNSKLSGNKILDTFWFLILWTEALCADFVMHIMRIFNNLAVYRLPYWLRPS